MTLYLAGYTNDSFFAVCLIWCLLLLPSILNLWNDSDPQDLHSQLKAMKELQKENEAEREKHPRPGNYLERNR